MLKYIPVINNKDYNFLKIESYYNIGHYNYFTGKEEGRGYYILVVPVYRARGCESVTGFTGIKQCIKTVSRKSKKAEAEAEAAALDAIPGLINIVCNKNNLQIAAGDVVQ